MESCVSVRRNVVNSGRVIWNGSRMRKTNGIIVRKEMQ